MRSYDQPDLMSYNLGSVDFTSGGPFTIPVPPDCSGMRVVGYAIDTATVAFTADTTAAALQFGDGTDADKFGQLDAAVIGAGDSLHVVNDAGGTSADYASAAGGRLDQVTVTVVAPTGGTPGGTGNLTVFMAWY
jgi:hypothetical protein